MPGELGGGPPPPGHVGAVCAGGALARPPQITPGLIRRVPPPPLGVCRALALALQLEMTGGRGEGAAPLSPCPFRAQWVRIALRCCLELGFEFSEILTGRTQMGRQVHAPHTPGRWRLGVFLRPDHQGHE